MNPFPSLKQDRLDRINYATSMLKGDASSWWHFVHEAFHAGSSQDWKNFRNVFLARWQVVLPERVDRE